MENLAQEDWKEKLANDPDAEILDVRTDAEIEEGQIPNAKSCDIYQGADFMEYIKSLNPNKSYYVYCRSGGRSEQACMLMNSVGIEKTYNLIGGFSNWEGEIV